MKSASILFFLFITLFSFGQKVTVTSKTVTSASSIIISENASRRGIMIYSETDGVYVKFSATTSDAASTTSYSVKLNTDDYYENYGFYWNVVGIVTAITSTGSATLRITEYFY